METSWLVPAKMGAIDVLDHTAITWSIPLARQQHVAVIATWSIVTMTAEIVAMAHGPDNALFNAPAR